MVIRRLPSPHDLAPLLQIKRPDFNLRRRRLAEALTIEDLRRIAKRRTPTAAFDYTDGAAEAEISLHRSREAFQDIEFRPQILRDVGDVDTTRAVLGASVRDRTDGIHADDADGRRSCRRGRCTRGGHPLLAVDHGYYVDRRRCGRAASGRNWFQLYMWKDRDRSTALVSRAASAGFDTLLGTVDVPVAGARLRDKRNGMTIPPSLTARTILDAIPRPWWWFDFLTTELLAFASLDRWSGTVAELLDSMFDPTVTYDDFAWIRDQWPDKVVAKGVQTVEDARRLAELGVDGIVLSNHGGRQLDRAPVPFHLLPDVVREVGNDTEILLDTGIMSGADIVAALALGARGTLIGRAYLYGLMAGGRQGVDRTIAILTDEIRRTMRLLGARSLDELEPSHVIQLQRFTQSPAWAFKPVTASDLTEAPLAI